jgi:micrococcal nuclease
MRAADDEAPLSMPADILPNSLRFVRVVRVVDGDTINVTFYNGGNPERVRLIGIDTPETVHPNRDVEHYGKEASDFTKTYLMDRHVWLQFDVGARDRFGRFLGYIWTEKPEDVDNEEEIRDKMFNARLLLGGYAQVMTIQPNSRYAELFVEFQREAREEGRGLWQQ